MTGVTRAGDYPSAPLEALQLPELDAYRALGTCPIVTFCT